jgi:hypothetical protein
VRLERNVEISFLQNEWLDRVMIVEGKKTTAKKQKWKGKI